MKSEYFLFFSNNTKKNRDSAPFGQSLRVMMRPAIMNYALCIVNYSSPTQLAPVSDARIVVMAVRIALTITDQFGFCFIIDFFFLNTY